MNKYCYKRDRMHHLLVGYIFDNTYIHIELVVDSSRSMNENEIFLLPIS